MPLSLTLRADPVHQNVVIDHIEELLKVDIHGIGISSLNKLQYLLDGLMCRTVRPEPETGFGEMGIKDRSENLTDRLLNNTIHDNGDTEISGAAVVLGNLDTLDRIGTISPIQQRCLDSFPVLMGILGKLLNRNTIDTGSPFVCPDLFPCAEHVISFDNMLHCDRIEGTVFHDAPHYSAPPFGLIAA